MRPSHLRTAGLGLLLSGVASAAAAQLPNASTAAFGMAGNFTAVARGYEAVAWNPANLAMPGRPFFSMGVGIVGGSTGLEPIDFRALHEFSGRLVDSATKVSWIEQARLAGGQRGHLDGGVTPLAFSLGPIGFQAGGSTYTSMNLSTDTWEGMLFGNAGNNNGQPKTLDLAGSSIRFGALSSAALSFALPIPINITNGVLAGEKAAIGLTAKYVMGNALMIAQDVGSTFGDELQLRFPMIVPDSSYRGALGNGVGADVSVAWSGGPLRVGVMAENVFNSFRWDTLQLVTITGVGALSADSSVTDFDTEFPFSDAPAFLRDIVTKQAYKPAITVGAAFQLMKSLTLTADLKTSTGGDEAIIVGPRSRMGVGAEWRILPFLPLRAGVASVTDGWQAGAGVGLRLLGYELGVATSIRRRGVANESGVMVGLVGIGR